MRFIFVAFIASLLSLSAHAQVQDASQLRSDWSAIFKKYQTQGTIVVLDARTKTPVTLVYNDERAKKRYSPASTYKIPHTLFALDAGAARDEFEVFPWDGVKRSFSAHNQDQNLRSAMRNSAIWVYEIFAQKIGEDQARQYLKKLNYGNADPNTAKGNYWVDGNLAISAYEQIAFLKRLYQNDLPFSVEHQRLVKDIMVVEAGHDWIIRAKTGWEGRYGWWVGWVEWSNGAVFFALNIDTPKRLEDLEKRELISRAVLKSIHALPAP